MTTWATCPCALEGRVQSYLVPLHEVLVGISGNSGEFDPDEELAAKLDPEKKLFLTGTRDRPRVLAAAYSSLRRYARSRGDRPLPKYRIAGDHDVHKIWFDKVASKEEYAQNREWESADLLIFELGRMSAPNRYLPNIVHQRVTDWLEKGIMVWLIHFGQNFSTSPFYGDAVDDLIQRYFETIIVTDSAAPKSSAPPTSY